MTQKQCPNCSSFKVLPLRYKTFQSGIIGLMLGVFLLFIFPIVGMVFIGVGIFSVVVGIPAGMMAEENWKCKSCGKIFKDKENAVHE